MVNVARGKPMAEAAVVGTRTPEQVVEPRTERETTRTVRGLPVIYLVLMAVVTVAGFLLRWPSFGDSLSGDEISTFYIVNGHSLSRVLSLVYSGQESTPPLYFVLAWLTKGWFGTAHMAQGIRLVSLVTGVAAIPLTFVLGLLTVGRRAALVGAVCVACSPFMIIFSTEARTYMLVLFLGLVSSICLLRAIDTNRLAWWAGYAVSCCAAVYSHYSVVFFLVAQFAWAFFAAPRARKSLILANVAVVAGFLPAIGGLRAGLRDTNFISTLVPVNLTDIGNILERFWIGPATFPVNKVPGNVAVLLAVAGLAVAVLGLAFAARKRRARWRPTPGLALIVVLALAPAVLMILYSWLRTDVLGGGNIIASWPAMALAIGALVTAPRAPVRIVAVTLVVVAYVIGGVKMLSPAWQRGDVHGALAYIERTGKSGDPIVSLPAFANPLSEVDAALAGTPNYTYVPGNTLDRERTVVSGDAHPVIRLYYPPLQEQFNHLAGPRPAPAFFFANVPSGQQVAQEAISAARHDTVFMVTPFPNRVWARNSSVTIVRQFFDAMALHHYHVATQVQIKSYALFSSGETVLIFRKSS